MSNQDRLLSDEELIERVFLLGAQAGMGVLTRESALKNPMVKEMLPRVVKKQSAVFNTQKRLYAESVIGEDRPYDKYGKCPRCLTQYQYQCTCDEAEDKLRAEQRARIK